MYSFLTQRKDISKLALKFKAPGIGQTEEGQQFEELVTAKDESERPNSLRPQTRIANGDASASTSAADQENQQEHQIELTDEQLQEIQELQKRNADSVPNSDCA